jgi:phosphoglycolate phosphatase-like HAD superfamily hydrolase
MNTSISRAVFLDFDGVLFDTVREAYAVTMVALERSASVADVDFGSKTFERFNRFRYLIGPAWNYYYLMLAIDKEGKDSTVDLASEYKKSLEHSARGEYCSFEENFFQARTEFRETDHDGWLSLLRPYNIVEDIRGLISEFKSRFFIVTTRDQESVIDLLRLYNLDISVSNVFAKKEFERHNFKVNIIMNLINKYDIKESLFIDDLEEHLVACRTIESLSTMQAKWGYVVPDKKEDNSAFLLKELERFIHGENVWA